jgi:hypothetical protein
VLDEKCNPDYLLEMQENCIRRRNAELACCTYVSLKLSRKMMKLKINIVIEQFTILHIDQEKGRR